ncbi:McrC family protein [Streptomycetaceae bacterium NBC_01309]
MPPEPLHGDNRVQYDFDEHRTVRLPREQLSEADHAKLDLLNRHQLTKRAVGTDAWELKAGGIVGVLSLERVRLVIKPKFAIEGDRLVDWLCYGKGEPLSLPPAPRRWQTGEDGYEDPVPRALLNECRQLLARGLRREYTPTQSVEPALRGRLNVTQQVSRGFGAVDNLHVDTFDRADSGWENILCRVGLERAVENLGRRAPALRREISEVLRAFPAPPRGFDTGRVLTTAAYTRVNAHYRPAHTWVALLLGKGGVRDVLLDEGQDAETLLLKMAGLWERVVGRMAHDAAQVLGGTVVASATAEKLHIGTSGDLGNHKPFRPDALVALPGIGHHYLPIDAKYKLYDTEKVESGDLHQMLTYIAGYTPASAPMAVIVHPHASGPTRRTLKVAASGRAYGSIEVIGIDTAKPPAEALAPLTDVIKEFMERAAESG